MPREWLQQAPPSPPVVVPPPAPAGGPVPAAALWPSAAGGVAGVPVAPPAAPPLPYDPTFAQLPPPPSVLPQGDLPFLDTPWVPPQTKRQAWMWLLYAVIGFLVGQIGALIFGYVAGAIAGKTSAQMTAIASASVPPSGMS